MKSLSATAESSSVRSLAGVPESIWLGLAVALVGAFLLFTLRAGHDWGDDFAMYIAHARNLVQGLPYGDTGFIPNAMNVPGPPTYPPVYPLLLAPLYHVFGMDFTMMKAQNVALLLLALMAIHRCLRRELSPAWSLALVVIFGLNPWLWEFKDEVRPDIAFLLFCFAALWLALHFARVPAQSMAQMVGRGVLLGAAFYLAYGTRSLGLVLIPTVLLAELVNRRRPTGSSMIALGVFAALWALQNILLHTDREYGHFLTFDPKWVGFNAWMYFRSLSVLWNNGYSAALRGLMFLAVLALATYGYVRTVRRQITVLEIFPWFYFPPLVLYWVGEMIQQRYVLPLLPLMLYYAFLGVRGALARLPAAMRAVVPSLLLVLVAAQYAARYSTLEFGPLNVGVTRPETVALLDFVRTRTEPKDVFVFGKPRLLALFTGRPSAFYYGNNTDPQLWNYLRQVDARYLIVAKPDALAQEMDYEQPRLLAGFVSRHPQQLSVVYSNADFDVYAIRAVPGREG